MCSNRRRILVVDDDELILKSISTQLRDADVDLHLESDPSLALERIEGCRYDLVLCDIKMKPIDGLRVLKEIKDRHPKLPVIMLSAFVDDETVEAARRLGCAEFLFKPIRRKPLKEAIDRQTIGTDHERQS